MKIARNNEFEKFEFLLPKGQEWFTPKEVGRIIGRSDQFVRNCFNEGKIMGHISVGASKRGSEKRTFMRVHRNGLIIYLLETANYTSEMFLESLKEVVNGCTTYQLMRIDKMLKEKLTVIRPMR